MDVSVKQVVVLSGVSSPCVTLLAFNFIGRN
jgi:hypothetical protein